MKKYILFCLLFAKSAMGGEFASADLREAMKGVLEGYSLEDLRQAHPNLQFQYLGKSPLIDPIEPNFPFQADDIIQGIDEIFSLDIKEINQKRDELKRKLLAHDPFVTQPNPIPMPSAPKPPKPHNGSGSGSNVEMTCHDVCHTEKTQQCVSITDPLFGTGASAKVCTVHEEKVCYPECSDEGGNS